MMEFDIVDVMHDVSRMENEAMVNRVPEPLKTKPETINTLVSSNTITNPNKPLTRLEKLLSEYDTETNEPVVQVSSTKGNSSSYMLSKMEFRGNRRSPPTVPEMDIITNMDDLAQLEEGKPWFRLDNWTKKQKLREFASEKSAVEGLPLQDTIQELMDLYEKGFFHKKNEVNYDIITNKIVSLQKVS